MSDFVKNNEEIRFALKQLGAYFSIKIRDNKEGDVPVELLQHVEKIQEYVDNLPSAEPELKHGKWIERWHENKHVVGDMACSVCGAQMLLTFPKFCPNCGAKMDESIKINYHVNFKKCETDG